MTFEEVLPWLSSQRDAFEAAFSGAPLQDSLGVLVKMLRNAIGDDARAAFYLLRNGKFQHVIGMNDAYAAAVADIKVGSDSLACGLALHCRKPILTEDVREEERWRSWLWLAEQFNFRACWSFPFYTDSGSPIGTLAIYSRGPRKATERDIELASFVSRTAAIIIARHMEAVARKEAECTLSESQHQLARDLADTKKLQEISSMLIKKEDTDSLYDEIIKAARALMRSDAASLQLLNADNSELQLLAWDGFHSESAEYWKKISMESGTSCGSTLKRGQRLIVRDVQEADFVKGTQSLRYFALSGLRAVQSTPLITREGELIGMISTHWRRPHEPAERELALFDVLARQAADVLERRRTLDSLRHSDRCKDEFLATLAHELRNPLTPIHNAAHVLKIRNSLGDREAALLGMIQRQTDHLVRLVDDLLEVARINQGKIELRKESVSMGAVIQDAAEACQSLIEKKDHHLGIRTTDDRVFGDSARLAQIATNLINNAAKYTPPGGHIDVECFRESDQIILRVQDDGIGINAEMLPHIFDLFAQVREHSVNSEGGLGIGLALVRKLVDLHGGRISAYSNGAGAGSEFRVYLPVHQAH